MALCVKGKVSTTYLVLGLAYGGRACACPPSLSLRRGGRVTSGSSMKDKIRIRPSNFAHLRGSTSFSLLNRVPFGKFNRVNFLNQPCPVFAVLFLCSVRFQDVPHHCGIRLYQGHEKTCLRADTHRQAWPFTLLNRRFKSQEILRSDG